MMEQNKITIITGQGSQNTYEYGQLAQMWKDGLLKAETLYWKEGMTEWKSLGELFSGLAPPPIPSGSISRTRKISDNKTINPQRRRVGYRWTKEPHILTATLIFLLFLNVVSDLVSMWSTYEESELLKSLKEGILIEDSIIEANDDRVMLIGIIYMILFIITAITFMIWTYRANLNSRGFAKGMKYTPGWSAAYYLIPIICLYKPYKVMMEIWKVSMNPAKWKDQGGTLLISFWWYSWIIYSFVGNAVMKKLFRSNTVDEMISANLFSMAHDILSVIVTLLAILVVNTIYNNQKRLVMV